MYKILIPIYVSYPVISIQYGTFCNFQFIIFQIS